MRLELRCAAGARRRSLPRNLSRLPGPILAWVLLIGAAHTAAGLVLTELDNGRIVDAPAGEILEIDLRGNPSTGYTWVTSTTNELAVVSTGASKYEPDASGAGVGGTFSFPFRAAQPGEAVLVFRYLQPWNPSNPAQTLTFTVRVPAPDPAPTLSIAFRDGQVVVAWPTTVDRAYQLEGTRPLATPAWAALNALPLIHGTNYEVRLAPTGDHLFFRLRR